MCKISRFVSLILLFINIFCVPSFSIINEVGINPLGLKVGARSGAMGDSYTAVSDDMNSVFYNPACFSKNKGLIFSAQGTKNFLIGQAATTSYGTLGFGIIYRSFDDFPYQASTASYESNSLFVGYGFRLGAVVSSVPYFGSLEDYYMGFNCKYLFLEK